MEEFDKDSALARLAEVRDSNGQRFQELSVEGGPLGISMNPAVIALTKLDALLETLVDDDARIVVETAFELKMSTILSEALSQVRQAKLAQGVNGSNLVIPNS